MTLVRSYSMSRSGLGNLLGSNSIPCLLILAAFTFATGCGSSTSPNNNGGGQFQGNTAVTLLLSSAGNDQLVNYEMYIQSLALNSQSEKTVALIASEQPTEFIHLNGLIEPYGTVTVPQGIYASATAKIGRADFTCMTVQGAGDPIPGSLTESIYIYGYVPDAMVSVNMPAPITITGDAMTLKLNLQVSQSATLPSSCYTTEFPAPYTITPTFELSAMSTVAPSNSGNGKVMGLVGEISTIETSKSQFALYISESHRFGMQPPQDPLRTARISINGKTAYYGISDFAALQPGSFVDLDGALQKDGSITASRISVHDPTALNVMFGPVTETNTVLPDLFSFTLGQQGVDYDAHAMGVGVYQFTDNTVFQITDQFNNLGDLPFVPSFVGANMVPGQNLAIYSQHISYQGGANQWNPATTMTLLPQTINGTIMSVSTNGYVVRLAPYDLFPALAIQPGQTNLLTYPDVVDVYTDSHTASLNTTPLAAGSTGRFYGLIFNDNGQLKMDCAQISDGADVTPAGSARAALRNDELPKVNFRMSADGKRQVYTYTKYENPDAQ